MTRSKNWQKLADRYLGIPLILILKIGFLARNLFHRRVAPKEPTTMAVFCLAAIGDLLLLSAAIQKFHRKFPKCQVTLFCGPDNQSMAQLIQDQFQLFAEIKVLQPGRLSKQKRESSFDVVVDAGQWSRWSALAVYFTPARWRIGFKTSGQGRHFLFDQPIEHRSDCHEIQNFHRLFANWVSISDEGLKFRTNHKQMPLNHYVVCHLFPAGSQTHQKEWPPESWLEVFRRLREMKLEVVLTGSLKDRQRLESFFRSEDLKDIHDFVGKLSLAESKEWLQGASFVISVNTGIMHLAASLDVPLLALHGPTNSKRWGPVSKRSQALQSRLGCSPCLNLGFEYGCPRNDCMKNITVDDVMAAVAGLPSKQS